MTTNGIDAAVTAVLRAEAAAQKLAWPALAELAGVPKSSVSNYLNDATPMKLATLDQLAGALGLDILEVVRRARERMGAEPIKVVIEAGVPTDEPARPAPAGRPLPRSPLR